jgi:hypothetical protein
VLLLPTSIRSWDGGAKNKEHAMSQKLNTVIAVVGIDIGKNSYEPGLISRADVWQSRK